MATNLNIDQKLLIKAKRLGGHKTKRQAVNEALGEYVQRREQMRIFKLTGAIDFDPNYDHKKGRWGR